MLNVHLCVSQVTDYAIARRIVDLHSRLEESVDRLYTLDEIRRYLLFARQFKPKVARLPAPIMHFNQVKPALHLWFVLTAARFASVDLQ